MSGKHLEILGKISGSCLQSAFKVYGRCFKVVWKVLGICLLDVCKLSVSCLEDISLSLFFKCLQSILKVFGIFLANVMSGRRDHEWKAFGGCIDIVWMLFGNLCFNRLKKNLGNSKIFDPKFKVT